MEYGYWIVHIRCTDSLARLGIWKVTEIIFRTLERSGILQEIVH